MVGVALHASPQVHLMADKFCLSVSVAISQQFFAWVFGLGKAVRIVAPESVKEQMKKSLQDIAEIYE